MFIIFLQRYILSMNTDVEMRFKNNNFYEYESGDSQFLQFQP